MLRSRHARVITVTALVQVLLVASLVGCIAAEWEVYRTHPFVEATADELPGHLREPARSVRIATVQNDWAHAALGIKLDPGAESATVTVGLDAEPAVAEHLQLRVAGFVNQKKLGHSIDPIFDNPGSLDLKLQKHVRNLGNIHDFPTVTVTQRDPVLLWITLDTRHMAPGRYAGEVVFSGREGATRSVPLRIEVGEYELPVENPLYTWGWQYGHDWVDDYYDYGINVVHINKDMERAREVGYRFFAIRFNPAWKSADPAEFDQDDARQQLAKIQQIVADLELRPEEWAIYMKDEPNDRSAPGQAKWCEWILQRWPEARFLLNPGWGPGPTNEWGSIEGTVEPLAPYADVWLPYSHWLWDDAAPRSVELMRDSADSVWFYEIMGSSYARRPGVGRGLHRRLAWTAWRYDLEGACWYSLNAYVTNMWSDNSETEEYACTYGTIPGRGLEAVRQGIQEYKRLYEMRRLGVPEAETDAFCQRLFDADSVMELTRIRRQMDRRLLQAAEGS
ncbi:MAG: hypothetical protein U9R79_14075 [Armatimonadota bacterium]|nr:hypothetical protein [Armatimonadota bacterium]